MGCEWRGLGVGGLGLVGFCGLCVERTGWGAGVGRVLWAVSGEDWGWGAGVGRVLWAVSGEDWGWGLGLGAFYGPGYNSQAILQ